MSKMVTYEQITRQHGAIRMVETLAAAMRVAEITSLSHDAALIEGERAPIAAGELVNVLHVRDMRNGGKTEVFGEFKALVYTDDYRCAWVMPHQITIEPAQTDIRAMSIARSDNGSTIWITLPRELWRPISGGCCCQYCSQDRSEQPAFWDTLAVATKKPEAGADTTWLVHRPAQHGARPLRETE